MPLIVSGPGVPAGRDVSQLTSSIDLAPTFETLAGLPVPAGVDGHSLAGLWHGQDPVGWPLAVLVEHHGPDFSPDDPDRQTFKAGDPPTYEAVRTATALYVRYAGGFQEYYDTATDPYELDNLAGQGVPEVLRQALSALENCHGGAACLGRRPARLTCGDTALAGEDGAGGPPGLVGQQEQRGPGMSSGSAM